MGIFVALLSIVSAILLVRQFDTPNDYKDSDSNNVNYDNQNNNSNITQDNDDNKVNRDSNISNNNNNSSVNKPANNETPNVKPNTNTNETPSIKPEDNSSNTQKPSVESKPEEVIPTKPSENANPNIILKNAKLEDITFENDRINIYFFWGNGCPHCKQEFEYFESINEEYKGYYNLYGFEIWYNEENSRLANQFASIMGDKLSGVPYTIVGDETFNGFGSSFKNRFDKTIKEQYNKKEKFDVYKNIKN